MSGPVIKKSGVYQKLNLKEMFGVDLSRTPELVEALAQAAIEKIKERTAEGKAIGGTRELKKYSEAYKNSLAFKAAGKDPKQVNMSLFGDMMSLMDVTKKTSNTVTIGWEDELQNLKAFNHNTGDTVTKRPFFGLSKGEIKELVQEFKPAVREAVKALKEEGRDVYTEKALEFLDRLSKEEPEGED